MRVLKSENSSGGFTRRPRFCAGVNCNPREKSGLIRAEGPNRPPIATQHGELPSSDDRPSLYRQAAQANRTKVLDAP